MGDCSPILLGISGLHVELQHVELLHVELQHVEHASESRSQRGKKGDVCLHPVVAEGHFLGHLLL